MKVSVCTTAFYRPETRIRIFRSNWTYEPPTMSVYYRSILTAAGIAIAIHAFTMGVLCDVLPREASPPLVHATRNLRFDEGNFLRLAHTDGSVEVFTHRRPEFLITADIRAYGRARLRENAETYIQTMVTGTVEGGGVRIQTERGERPEPLDIRTDYRLTVPEGANVSVEGVNGNVLFHEGCGALFVQGNNTDIKIIHPGAAVRAESNNGRIHVEGAPGETVLKTVNGNIYARMAGGYLEAQTTNGAVAVALDSGGVTKCDLTSLNGGITLSVSDAEDLGLTAETDSGTVNSGLDLVYDEGYPRRRKIVGSAGSGLMRIHLYSRNGDINIVRNGP